MHRVISICRQAIDDYFAGGRRDHAVGRDRVAHDTLVGRVAFFGVERSFVEADAGPTAILLRRIRAEATDYVCLAIVVGVAERD
jgi:hypothetical protein